MRRLLPLATLVASGFVLAAHTAALATPGANQLTSWSALCAAVPGTFSWSGATPANCTNLPQRIISWPDFTGNVTHTGSPCGTGNPLPSWSQLLTCRGSGSTLTSQSLSSTGSLFTTDGTTCSATGSGGTSYSFSTPTSTVAPTGTSTQLSFAFSQVAKYAGDAGTSSGTGVAYSLANPSGTTVLGPTTVTNGTTPTVTYSAAGAPAGVWKWTITNLGSETCTGVAPNKVVNNGSAEQFTASASWYQ